MATIFDRNILKIETLDGNVLSADSVIVVTVTNKIIVTIKYD